MREGTLGPLPIPGSRRAWWWYCQSRDEPPIKSSQRPRARLTAGRVDIAPWLPQCCTVSPIHAPASPARPHTNYDQQHWVNITFQQADWGWMPRMLHGVTGVLMLPATFGDPPPHRACTTRALHASTNPVPVRPRNLFPSSLDFISRCAYAYVYMDLALGWRSRAPLASPAAHRSQHE